MDSLDLIEAFRALSPAHLLALVALAGFAAISLLIRRLPLQGPDKRRDHK